MSPAAWDADGAALQGAAWMASAKLASALRHAGARVETMEGAPGAPDLVFPANAAVVLDRRAILARFLHPERQVEEPLFRRAFEEPEGARPARRGRHPARGLRARGRRRLHLRRRTRPVLGRLGPALEPRRHGCGRRLLRPRDGAARARHPEVLPPRHLLLPAAGRRGAVLSPGLHARGAARDRGARGAGAAHRRQRRGRGALLRQRGRLRPRRGDGARRPAPARRAGGARLRAARGRPRALHPLGRRRLLHDAAARPRQRRPPAREASLAEAAA